MPRLLILTLNSGEEALPTLQAQLASQSFQSFDHEILTGLDNIAAHACLYERIKAGAGYDLFLKLDADMTLRRRTALEEVVLAITPHADVDHFAFDVFDSFIEEGTLGVHLFRSGVRWPIISDPLFVDPDPPNVKQLRWHGPPAPFVNHGEIVSDFECFSFGVHRFLKAAQRGRCERKAHKCDRHIRNCARIRTLYRTSRSRRHLLALIGIAWAMHHRSVVVLQNKASLCRAFEGDVQRHGAEWRSRAERLCRSELLWRAALLRDLGPRCALGGSG